MTQASNLIIIYNIHIQYQSTLFSFQSLFFSFPSIAFIFIYILTISTISVTIQAHFQTLTVLQNLFSLKNKSQIKHSKLNHLLCSKPHTNNPKNQTKSNPNKTKTKTKTKTKQLNFFLISMVPH